MFDYTEELSHSRFLGTIQRHAPVHKLGRSLPDAELGRRVGNALLQALPWPALEELAPYLERVLLKRKQVLHERNLQVTHAYFIEHGLASLMAKADDQCLLEVGTLGRQDFVGTPIVLGTARTPHRCVVQVAGEAWRISAEALQDALTHIPALRRALFGYVQAASVQSAQLAVCNTRHGLRQRLARWLLFAHDRVAGDEIALTHQFLGRALGVRRAGVTTAMGRLEEAGMIHRGRGRIMIMDRTRLEHETCDCYRAISSEYKRITCDPCSGSEFAMARQ